MDKWKRIIEPAGDSESSGWSSDDSNASCSISHYRLSQYYDSKMRNRSQEGRVCSRDEDDNPDDSCWQDFSANYRGQPKKIRLSQVNVNCSTSVVSVDGRENNANTDSPNGRTNLYSSGDRTWDVENEGSSTRPYIRSRYEPSFFNEPSTSFADAESTKLTTINNRSVVDSPSIGPRSKRFSPDTRKSTSDQPGLNATAVTGADENEEVVDHSANSAKDQPVGIDSGRDTSSAVSNKADEGRPQEKEIEPHSEDGDLPNMDLNQSLISLLECPVCLEYVFPPINQCKRGHLVCSTCKPQLNNCPTCRSRFNETRNLAMEQVAEKLYFPCRNHASGCKGMYLLQNKREHEANCHYRTYKCIVSHCLWKGFQPDILGHMIEVHKKIVVYGENQLLRLKLDTCVHFTQNWVVSAFNQVFRVNFLVSYLRSQIAGCVQFLGPRKFASNYTYTFDISTDNRRLLYSRQTHGDTARLLSVYSTGDCFFLRTDAANYFVSDRVIKVMLQIKKVSETPE
ncbi:E3 ubiquitin-protein ligase sina-like [Ischnura elegans]|uniref:E3 ubiquitin-protein ligase sina-like n=1 Tax=Ischnura elegans TaxID=197161 RepID=UPI001ED86A33|nr:E3 ubiquitin-protein ligase sina-like [Ischnura elegans]